MVTIDIEIIKNILLSFLVKDEVIEYNKIYDLQVDGFRTSLVYRIETKCNDYILKFVFGEDINEKTMEFTSNIINLFIKNNIPTPKRYKNINNNYYSSYISESIKYFVTLEDYVCGNELVYLSYSNITQLGEVLAKMHMSTEKAGIKVHKNSMWALFFDNNLDSFNFTQENLISLEHFNKKISDLPANAYNIDLFKNINEIYTLKKNLLNKNWSALPCYAVHGDFSSNNIIISENDRVEGIIDYHLVADDVLLNDLVSQAMLFCYTTDLQNNMKDSERDTLYKHFISSYIKIRLLNSIEKSVLNDLSCVVLSLGFVRRMELDGYVENNQYDKINSFMLKTLEILKQDWI